ncbi:hypothetical protein LJK87_18250 [Paenibacillus sp. P25]|nr:hypothetical protein LJK87_18250 [Paenibacillus sp. P25]
MIIIRLTMRLPQALLLIDPGHNVEKIMKQGVADILQKKLQDRKWSTTVTASKVHTEPFRFV